MGEYPYPVGRIRIHSPKPLVIPRFTDASCCSRQGEYVVITGICFSFRSLAIFLHECLQKNMAIDGTIECTTGSTLSDAPFGSYESVEVYNSGKRILFTTGGYNFATKQYLDLKMYVFDVEHLLLQ